MADMAELIMVPGGNVVLGGVVIISLFFLYLAAI
jgi:hypothetical protein